MTPWQYANHQKPMTYHDDGDGHTAVYVPSWNSEASIAWLNDLGADGWELVAITSEGSGLFKRPGRSPEPKGPYR